ncbi:MAG TPA: hypothetical protein VFM32_11445 [Spongiibacteraceae bacterium]|nr:hypothetical protein [Spongiibacteraceae bacterium]
MKRRTSARAQVTTTLLFAIGAQLLAAVASAAPAPAVDSGQIAQLLDQLGVRAALEQAPAVLAAAFDAETQFEQAQSPSPSESSPEQKALTAGTRRDLEAQMQPPALLQAVTRNLREHYSADTFRRALQRLQEPLAKRARYFDLAMTQPGAEKNLRDFLAQRRAEAKDGKGDASDADARRAVLRDIDAASGTSLLAATLQSAIAARVQQVSGKAAIDTGLLNDEIAERQRYLAPLAVDYLLYDYRYLRDDELQEYRDLLRDEALQTVLDICRQAVLTAIVGELTLPTGQPQ